MAYTLSSFLLLYLTPLIAKVFQKALIYFLIQFQTLHFTINPQGDRRIYISGDCKLPFQNFNLRLQLQPQQPGKK